VLISFKPGAAVEKHSYGVVRKKIVGPGAGTFSQQLHISGNETN